MNDEIVLCSVLYSTLASDPDLSPLVDMFVAELPQRIAEFHRSLADGNLEQVGCLAHQLKGALGSYGFQPLMKLAAAIETTVARSHTPSVVLQAVEKLDRACRLVRPGVSQPSLASVECPANLLI